MNDHYKRLKRFITLFWGFFFNKTKPWCFTKYWKNFKTKLKHLIRVRVAQSKVVTKNIGRGLNRRKQRLILRSKETLARFSRSN